MLKASLRVPVILTALVFTVGFFVFGFTYGVPCQECGSDGRVRCGYCGGDGVKLMPIREEGRIIGWVLDDCPVCEGSGHVSCDLCRGTGSFWMLSVTSSFLLFFLLHIVIFYVVFHLDCGFQSVYLESNPWVRDVEEMSWSYFRPMYWTWLFYHDQRRWVKYNMILLSISVPIVVLTWSLIFRSIVDPPRMTPEIFSTGFALGTILMILFAIKWYSTFARKTMTHTKTT